MGNTKKDARQVDIFADLGAQGRSARQNQLVEPLPPVLPNKILPAPNIAATQAAFRPHPKMDQPTQLKRELSRMRRRYAKFRQNLAPSTTLPRIKLPIQDFQWRLQESDDLGNCGRALIGAGEWQPIRIPHYGGPIGRATAYYRTPFNITPEMLALGRLWICFKGVDYIAQVYVNGLFVGKHEGFFAPFDFDITAFTHTGDNTLLVQVDNDAICLGNESWGQDESGDKIYAATGPGWDDPYLGWHHCPPGMGIYQPVTLEARSPVFLSDVFILPNLESEQAEVWGEINNCGSQPCEVQVSISIFGQNFREMVCKDLKMPIPGLIGTGIHQPRWTIPITRPRIWDLDAPWLYQCQVVLRDGEGSVLDTFTRSFGMRSFRMEEDAEPLGRFYLNDQMVRLRGANTMGFEQQDVINEDWGQLEDDILLAKICHLNFLRLTQRPVQDEVYTFCDQLGMMTQTDLPLFGVLRRSQFAEAIRQASEMERVVRSHPCNVLVSYINEPYPAEWGVRPDRHLTRPELEAFFESASLAVHLTNPQRVIKPVDGDYDPPAPGLPDNHCYCGWYNGHGIDMGKLHRGYWQPVKPGWLVGCGEFGSEGLDPVDLMHRRYPPEWLPQSNGEEIDWSPSNILRAQSGNFHYFFYDTQPRLDDWVRESQAHQAWATRLMTEAFRRDARMGSFAIHLIIDAFPSGWMKAIMDCERQPKPAYFAYREALTPLMVNLRTDRFMCFAGETLFIEAWICNDLSTVPEGGKLQYQMEQDKKAIAAGSTDTQIPICSSTFQGYIPFKAPAVSERTAFTLRLGLLDNSGHILHDTSIVLQVFPFLSKTDFVPRTVVLGRPNGPAWQMADTFSLPNAELEATELILIDDFDLYQQQEKQILSAVQRGAKALFLELMPGHYRLMEETLNIEACQMNGRHFVSRATGHPLVSGFQPKDFKFWYDPAAQYVTPLLDSTFTFENDPNWAPILTTGNPNHLGIWHSTLAAAERKVGAGRIIICQVNLAGRMHENPIALIFARHLIGPV